MKKRKYKIGRGLATTLRMLSRGKRLVHERLEQERIAQAWWNAELIWGDNDRWTSR